MKKVLVVDDELHVLDQVYNTISSSNVAVFTAVTIDQAEQLRGKHKFDLIITDGNIETEFDGIKYATKLYEEGQNVLLRANISGRPHFLSPELPFISKREGLTTLWYKVKELLQH